MKRRKAIQLIAISGIAATGEAQHAGHTAKGAGAKKASPPASAKAYKPKAFTAHEFAVITRLADLIIPRDATPGALDARVPEYIDLQVSHTPDAQVRLSGGVLWLDRFSTGEFGKRFLECSADQQKSVLDRLAYADKVTRELRPGRAFFVTVRHLTCDGFYTSKLGFADVGYKGNVFVSKFVGCTHPEHGA